MADTVFGSATLELTNIGHHHFVPERRRVISSQQDSIFFSSLTRDGNKLTDWPTVYLVVFVNLAASSIPHLVEVRRGPIFRSLAARFAHFLQIIRYARNFYRFDPVENDRRHFKAC